MSRGFVKKDPSVHDSPWVLDEALLIFDDEEDWHYFMAIAHSVGLRTSHLGQGFGTREDGSKSWILWVDKEMGWEAIKMLLDPWFQVTE